MEKVIFLLDQKESSQRKNQGCIFPFPPEYFLVAIGYLRGDLPASGELPLRLNAVSCVKNTG